MKLPLLGRELGQQAASGRTYLIRVGYGLTLLLLYANSVPQLGRAELSGSALHQLARVGAGRAVLFDLMLWQVFGIYLVGTALMSGSIAGEKQGRTLELLLVAGMSPPRIVLQKFLARLVPLITIVLVGLPLLAAAFSLGGIGAQELVRLALLLVLCAMQAAALGLAASARARTPMQALGRSYVQMLLALIASAIVAAMLAPLGGRAIDAPPWVLAANPPLALDAMRVKGRADPLTSAGMLAITVALLARAARDLRRHAVADQGKPRMGEQDWRLRKMLPRRHWTGRVAGGWPRDAPVAWRVVQRAGLGRVGYRLVAATLTVPTALLCFGMFADFSSDFLRPGWQATPLSAVIAGLWSIALIGVGSVSAAAIGAEHASKTLPLLLTTPLTGPAIVEQTLRGVQRVGWLLLPPLAMLVLTEAALEASASGFWLGAPLYVLVWGLATAVSLQLITWVGMACGLWFGQRTRAILATLLILLLWTLLPPLLSGVLADSRGDAVAAGLRLLSPAQPLVTLETWPAWPGAPLAGLHVLLFGAFVVGLRRVTLREADRLLGRPVDDRPRRRRRARDN